MTTPRVRQQDTASFSENATMPQSTLRLSREEAAKWLTTLQQVGGDREHASRIEALYRDLEDACWLARWKREHPVLQMDSTTLIEATQALLEAVQTDPECDDVQTLETILQSLSSADRED